MIYPSFWIRVLAHLIDFVLLNLVEVGLEYGISLPLGIGDVVQQIIGVILSFILAYVYYVEIPMRRGTTFGKKLFDIYVVDIHTGENFSKRQAIIRLFSYLLSYAIVGCGFLMAAFHPRKLCLHDLIAGTICVRRKKGEENALGTEELQVPELTGEESKLI